MRKSLSDVHSDCKKRLSFVLKVVSIDTAIPTRYHFTVSASISKWIQQKTGEGKHDRASQFLRRLVEAAAENRRCLTPSQESAIRSLTVQIRDCGVLLNQIAKHTNTLQRVSFADLRASLQQVQRMERHVLDFLRTHDYQKPFEEE